MTHVIAMSIVEFTCNNANFSSEESFLGYGMNNNCFINEQ